MKTLSDIDEVYSDEVDEILGTIPPRIMRVGITTIFIILMGIVIGSYFIKYPKIVSAPVVLTTLNSPAPLVSRTGGRLSSWFVLDGQVVESGSPVALVQSTGTYEDIKLVQSKLNVLSGDWEKDAKNINLPGRLVLGNVQGAYLNFQSAMNRLKYYIEQNSISHKLRFHEQLINLNKERYKINLNQKIIKEKEFEITSTFFSEDSLFFEQNKFGIAKREYDLSVISMLQERESLLAFDATLKSLESSSIQMKQEIIDLKAAHANRLTEYMTVAYESKKLLESAISSWIEDFVLLSPIRGKVTFTNFWSSNQVIDPGQRVATIVPLEHAVVVARAHIPSSQLGLVDVGQAATIKLSGFPFMEFGYIRGKVKTISLVPEEEGYVVEIDLPNGMVSSYSEKLRFVHEMEGIAEITVKDYRLMHRLFHN